MKPIVQLSKFPDGRLKLVIQFCRDSNFWILDSTRASWVPTLEEVEFLKETLDMTNEHNEIKRNRKGASA